MSDWPEGGGEGQRMVWRGFMGGRTAALPKDPEGGERVSRYAISGAAPPREEERGCR